MHILREVIRRVTEENPVALRQSADQRIDVLLQVQSVITRYLTLADQSETVLTMMARHQELARDGHDLFELINATPWRKKGNFRAIKIRDLEKQEDGATMVILTRAGELLRWGSLTAGRLGIPLAEIFDVNCMWEMENTTGKSGGTVKR
jgi:hypothetical protein